MAVSFFFGVMGAQLFVFLFILVGHLALDVCGSRIDLHEEGAHPTFDDRGPAIIAANNAIIGADTTLRSEEGRSNVVLSGASHRQDIVINVSGVDFSLEPNLAHQKFSDDNNLEALAAYISLFLERGADRASFVGGTLAMGEDKPQLDTVLAMPHIPALLSPSYGQLESSHDLLTIAVETSIVAHTMDHPIDIEGPVSLSLASPYSLVPASVARAIYSGLEGAELTGGLWGLPCDTRIGVSVIIGGEMYPIHPRDTVLPNSSLADGRCAGSFQPLQDEQDGVTLGWAFLRNTYMLVHARNTTTGEGPYIQLLPLSNETEERVAAQPDVSKATITTREVRRDDDDSNDDDDDHSDETTDDDSEHNGDSENHESDDKDNTPVLIGIAVAAGVMVIVAIALIIWIRRRKFWREHQRYRKRASNVTSYAELGMHADGHHSVMSLRPNAAAAAAQDAHSGMGVGHGRNMSSDSLMSEHPSRPPSASSMNNFRTFGHHNKSSLSIVEYPPAAYSRMPASRSPSPEMVGTHTRGSSSQDIRATRHDMG